MPKLKERDFYLGAALSSFLRYNFDTKPSMIERVDDKTQWIKMLTNSSQEFNIFMKYTTKSVYENENQISWQFALNPKDKTVIQQCIDSGLNTYIFFVCGLKKPLSGEIAIMSIQEYNTIKHKSNLTIKLKGARPHVFTIHIGKANADTFSIDRNRIEKKFE